MQKKHFNQVNQYIFLGIIVLFAATLLLTLLDFFTAFLGAVMFYVLSKPLVDWLLKKGRSKALAAGVVILISFFIILLPIGFMAIMLYGKIAGAISNQQALLTPLLRFSNNIQQKFHINIVSASNLQGLQQYATGLLSSLVNGSFSFLTTISMMYFFLYFMIQNSGRIEAGFVLYLPFKRDKIELFGHELKAQTFSNAVGVPLIAIVHGVLAFTAYEIGSLQEAGFWGVMTGFASVIPLIGTGLIWLPASVYLLSTGHTWQGIFISAWGLLIIGLSDNVIRFVLAKRMADVHPVVTVLGVIIGLRYFGITGLIFGPLIISYFLILLKIYYAEYQKEVAEAPTKPMQ